VVSEVALAQQLEVSRTPVHDALRQLAKDGLVEQRANRRAVIATFTREDVEDIYEMRKLLEGEAARRAATRLDRPTLARLRAAADDLRDRPSHLDFIARWADHDDDLHNAIARAAGSPRLWHDIARYRLLHRPITKLATDLDGLRQGLEEHYLILAALERRDGKEASRAMVAHIREWQAYFVSQFSR
jgi:DNA-binding GntR family transcriptional regulator